MKVYEEPTEFLDRKDNPRALVSQVGKTIHIHQALKISNKMHFQGYGGGSNDTWEEKALEGDNDLHGA